MGLLLLMEWQTTAWQVSGKKDNDKSYFKIFIFICRYVVFWLEFTLCFFSLFVVCHKNIPWSQRLFLKFFVHERESDQRGGDNELQSSKERRKTSGTRVTKVLYQKVSIYSK